MTIWHFAVLTLTAIFIVTTWLPLLRCQHWLIRGFDFPRLQIVIALGLLLIIQLDWLITHTSPINIAYMAIMCFVTSISFIWQLWWILPYTRLWKKEVKSAYGDSNHSKQKFKQNTKHDHKHCFNENEVSILTANVLGPNRQADKLLNLVEKYDPDILVTLESNKWWQGQLDKLESVMPYTVKCPLENLYGMHVYSKLELCDTSIEYLIQENVPSIHTTITLTNNQKVKAHFLHPAPPSPTENETSTERDVELIFVARELIDKTVPTIVTGDLNDVAWSKTTRLFRKFSGLLDPRIGRGMFNTFHVDIPFARWPLDHLFHSKHFTVAQIKRLPSIGSDHFPLFTRLVYSPKSSDGQEGLDIEAGDKELADDLSSTKNQG